MKEVDEQKFMNDLIVQLVLFFLFFVFILHSFLFFLCWFAIFASSKENILISLLPIRGYSSFSSLYFFAFHPSGYIGML